MDSEAPELNSHYAKHTIDAIDVADAWGLDRYLFSALKYIQRRGNKTGQTVGLDMAKAVWYITYYATQNKTLADDFANTIIAESTKGENKNV